MEEKSVNLTFLSINISYINILLDKVMSCTKRAS